MAFSIFIWILTILSFKLIEGQTLPEGSKALTTETACAGDYLRGSCPDVEVIAVKQVKYGTKLTSTCPLSSNATGCCDNKAADCFDPPYTGTTQQAACSGRGLCTDVAVGEEDTSVCGGSYPGLNHYLTMDYYCIPKSRIGSSSSTTLEETGNLIYLQNTDYPEGSIRASETSLSCSVEAANCISQVNVYFVHFELSDGGFCSGTQNIQIVDKGMTHTYTCLDNTDYTIDQKLRSTSNYLNITLNNPDGTPDGKFWIGYKATESSAALSVNCPAVSQIMCMDCPALGNIPNGAVSTSDGLSTGKTANYSCEPGFDLLGNTPRTCLETGQWSGQEPTCLIKVCPSLTNPEHGTVTTTGESVGQTATYACDSGYLLSGNVSRTCQVNRTWSGDEPSCVWIECRNLEDPPNGKVSADDVLTVGKNATYECNYGYQIQGEESRSCQLNGTWDGNEPVCAEIVCPELDNLSNGKVTTDNGRTVDQTAFYECNSGYSLSGDSSRICQLDGTWSGDKPSCLLIEACPDLSSPENGQVSTNGNTTGSQATYSCSNGFIISNSASRVCQGNYTWSGSQPTCTKRELGDPCKSEADCLDAIPESTCKNNICVCPEDTAVEGKQCVKIEESKPGGDDKMPIWVWIIIGVVGFLVLVLIIAVCCYLRRRKRYVPENQSNEKTRQVNHLIDDTDQYQMDYEKTKNVEKDTHAYANDAYQGLEDKHEIAVKMQEIVQTNHILVNEIGGKGENIAQTENAGKQSNGEIKPLVDKDTESVMVIETTKQDDKDVEEFNRLPRQHTDPPDQDQTGLDTNTGIQDYSNTNLNNKGNENDQDNIKPKKTEEQVNKVIEPPVDKDSESVMCGHNSEYDHKDDQEFNSIPHKTIEPTGEEQNEHPKHEVGIQQDEDTEPFSERTDSFETLQKHIVSTDESKHPEAASKDSIEATEEEIKDAVNLDERFSEASDLIKDVTTALFRSASMAKKDFVAKASLAGFSFDTTEDGEWSKGLISAAKSVLAAIFSMCTIANEMVEGKASEEKMNAATKEVKQATIALVVSYHVEGYSESDSLQKLKTACGEVNKAAESLLTSASSKYNTESEPKSAKKKSITLESSEVQKKMKRIEAEETVMRKRKEYEEAQRAKALINEEQNRFESETTRTTETTEL